jgi:hypothetical protein
MCGITSRWGNFINFIENHLMGVTVKKRLTKEEKDKILNAGPERIKPIKVSKYKGKFKWKGDPLKIQKEWRDE